LSLAEDNVVNVYGWSSDMSNEIIQAFEKETGIKVNHSGYSSNEELYAKLRAIGPGSYDVIEPSSYYVSRMIAQNMLEPIDVTKLKNYKNIDPEFLHPSYDPKGVHAIPYFWGVTGIFVNRKYYPDLKITRWTDLWQPQYKNQLFMLDDPRELFSIALITLGYSPNDSNREHIKQAYERLRLLSANIKLYNSSAVVSIVGDEDATLGIMWNGNFYSAAAYNKNLEFIFPEDGFVIWVDNFAIPKGAEHKENAYKFIDFLLKAETAKAMSLNNSEAITNTAGRKLLPPELRDSKVIYPSDEILKRGIYQEDINDAALADYANYWEKLKLQ
jgi:spermidine/putrescine transport system substrate-binding protein